ncbi:hypothetical protein EV356DRAFT_496357, partial [Viridothelium virens]
MQSLTKPQRLQIYIRRLQSQPCYRNASTASAITPAAPIDQTIHSVPPIARHPPTQPPSHKPPEFRKSQLLRSYASLLRSSPLILLFQHNNIRSVEWMALRREIAVALRKLEETRAKENGTEVDTTISSGIKLQILQTGIFAAALRIVEFYHPEETHQHQPLHPPPPPHPTDPRTQSSTPLPPSSTSPAPKQNTTTSAPPPLYTHDLSPTAHLTVAHHPTRNRPNRHALRHHHGLEPLLSGPLCALTLPSISPPHLSLLLRLLAPSPPAFAAPKRREQPGYHDPAVQAAVAKLLLLGARVEGRGALDRAGTEWVGGLVGGLEGTRAELVRVLQGAGVGIVGALEGAGRAVYGVVEGRRRMLEEGEEG